MMHGERARRRGSMHPLCDVAEALRGTHWYDVREWATSGPGTNGSSSNAA